MEIRDAQKINSIRLQNIDFIKGVTIIFMVMAHSKAPFSDWIGLFHMPVFFMVSGYCWNSRNSHSFNSVKSYVVRRIKGLYIPYIIANIAFTLMNNIFVKMGIYSDDARFIELLGNNVGINHLTDIMSIKEMGIAIIKCLLMADATQLSAATWFFRTLLCISIGHCIFIYFAKKTRIEYILRTLLLVICIILAHNVQFEGSILREFIPSGVLNVFVAYVLYNYGMLVRIFEESVNIYKDHKWILLSIMGVILFFMRPIGYIALDKAHIENIIFLMVVSTCGWSMLSALGNVVPNTIKELLIVIGQNTIPIVVLHFVCMKIFTLILILIRGDDLLLLASFPTLSDAPKWGWCIYTFIGVAVPLLLNYLYRKCKQPFRMEIN